LYNAAAQTGASYFAAFVNAGLRQFRVDLLEENRAQSERVISAYQRLLRGECPGEELSRELGAQSQLGVTRGTLE
jgi:putative protease